MYYINEHVMNLDRVFDQNKREGFLRLDLNENPGGLPEEFIRKVLSNITPEFVAQYPETLEFTELLAGFLGTGIENICLVNGSAEGVRYIIEAFTRPGGRIVGVSPSYAMFEVYSKMYGRNFVPVEYDDNMTMPVKRITDNLTPDTDLAIILNPNNPVGNVYSEDEMNQIIAKTQEYNITVLIDEAYIYFYPNEFLKYALTNPHVFITRTFSKLFSLAGCRLGYVAGQPEGIALIQKLCTPHNVNAFAMKFAGEIIRTKGMIEDLIHKQKDGKKFLVGELEDKGYNFHAGEGNFIFIKPRTDAEILTHKMKSEKKILIKTYSGIGQSGKLLRVTTGERKYMQEFLNALFELDR